MNPDYALILSVLYPESIWNMTNNDYSTLEWYSSDAKPTQKKLNDAWAQVQFDRQYAAVEQSRRVRYQKETDGLFFSSQRDGNDLSAWIAAVEKIKTDLPYPQSEI